MLGLHQNNLDFEILETGNSKTLVFLDSSTYFQSPERPLLEVTLPGYDKYLLVNVLPQRLNTFNSSTIGLSRVLNCNYLVDLPDGLYGLKFKICPYDLQFKIKHFVRATLLNQKIENIYNQIDLNTVDAQFKNDLQKVHLLIESSKAVANVDSKKAVNDFKTASELVNKLSSRVCKNCK